VENEALFVFAEIAGSTLLLLFLKVIRNECGCERQTADATRVPLNPPFDTKSCDYLGHLEIHFEVAATSRAWPYG
tara:strand:- start:1452 stop:1676 length:225 start_codon:yes stop_codon:yes gene_type:complete